MDIVLMLIYVSLLLGFLVIIHEGGHYLAARAFGVRVTEFMVGFPGPGLSFRHGETRFGVTCVPLGGYARICGMETGPMSSYLQIVLGAMYARGTAVMEDIAHDCGISEDDALKALDELVEWGCVIGPKKTDEYNTYRLVDVKPTRRQIKKAQKAGQALPVAYAEGQPRPCDNVKELFEHEYKQQYRSLPFWKRSIILLAGITVNLLFAVLAFVIIYSVLGFDVQNTETEEITHYTLNPVQSIAVGFNYIAMVAQAIVSLFNPSTMTETVSQSSSIVGIAIMSKTAAEQGFETFLLFTAMISVSLGLMNLLPITPLDGGRFVIEIYQRITRKLASERALNVLTSLGMCFILVLCVVMVGQDIMRVFTGFWSQ